VIIQNLKKLVWKVSSPTIGLKFNELVNRFEDMPSHFIESKSIFIHIPKAAGLSFVKSIYDLDYSNHNRWDYYYKIDKKLFQEFYKFTITREPVDRLKSAYNYLKYGGRTKTDLYWKKTFIDNYTDLSDFINNGLEKAVYSGVEHFIPQYKYIYDSDLKLMVDFIGKYENLENDFEKISNVIPTAKCLEKINIKEPYSINLTDTDISIIKTIYEKDFELLEYK
jgi:hypothetical protein